LTPHFCTDLSWWGTDDVNLEYSYITVSDCDDIGFETNKGQLESHWGIIGIGNQGSEVKNK
jgi:hypothetical protein